MDQRLKVIPVVGFCGGTGIILCAVLAFVVAYALIPPDVGPEESIYNVFAALGMFIFGFLAVFLLSSYVVFGLAGAATALVFQRQITRLLDAALLPLASGLATCFAFVLIIAVISILLDAYSGTPGDLSGLGTAFVASVFLLFVPGTAISCIAGAITWAAARRVRPPMAARAPPEAGES